MIDPGQSGLATLDALRVVDDHRGAGRVQDLSDELSIAIGTASKLVDRVEAAGLVTRRPNPHDRRSSVLELTPAGRTALRRSRTIVAASLERYVGDDHDVATATDALRRLHDRLRRELETVGA